MNIEDKLAVNKYDIDRDVHIKIKEGVCNTCNLHSCINICPAGCFKLSNENIIYSYEGCLECGSCRIACDKGAVDWVLPRAGFGICYEYG